ncbi:MAG TPA: 4'-phosphopantetheinyl transferase superfamily protein [Syntrophorhabdus sp.]|nr:4'-phosphopantetheinyl transferase superfamily protein [Syntrophorhabdus sp.]
MIGIDLVYISEFERVLECHSGHSLRDKICTKKELDCVDDIEMIGSLNEALAGLFAAKEAVIKASDGDLNIGDLQRIEITQDNNGKVFATIINNKSLKSVFHVSVSYDRDYVIAIAVSSQL